MLTVVVPVYNEQDYLERCLKSLVKQTHKCEVIVVDDGSTDNSGKICDYYIPYGFKVVHTENKGVSNARNVGIEMATTEYVTFLDADDHWQENAVEVIEYNLKKFRSEPFIKFNHFRQYNSPEIHLKYTNKQGYYKFDDLPQRWQMVWNGVYKKSYLEEHKIRFRGSNWGEDAMFNYECVAYYGKCFWVEDAFAVHHFDNPKSLTHTLNLEMVIKAKVELRQLAKDLDDNGIEGDIVDEVYDMVLRLRDLTKRRFSA